MQRGSGPKTRRWRAGDLLVDAGRNVVEREGQTIVLPRLSFDLLCALLEAAPDFVSNDELMTRVWTGLVVSPETVTQRVKLLRDALGDDPRQPRYIAGLRSRGYRCIVPVTAESVALGEPVAVTASASAPEPGVPAANTASAAPSPPSGGTGWTGSAAHPSPRLTLRVVALALLAVALLSALAWVPWPHWRSGTAGSAAGAASVPGTASGDRSAAVTVVVLPFASLSGTEADAYLGPALSEAIQTSLARVSALAVIARESASQAARTADPMAAARSVGADHVVLGSVLRNADALRVMVRLVRTRDGAQVWARQFDRPVADLLKMQDEIAAAILPAMEATVVRPAANAERPTPTAEAYLAYLHGRVLVGRFTVREAEAAAVEFERAVTLDPSFAQARVALFDARMQAASLRRRPLREALDEYLPLLQGAEQLDPGSGAVWYARAMWVERDPSAIEAAFRRALMLDPRDSRGLTAYSEFLDDHDRDEDARAMLDAALRIDPLSARARFRLNQRHFKQVGSGVEQYSVETLRQFPDFYPALQRYGKYRWMGHGDFAQAIAVVERAIASDPQNPWGPHTAAAFYVDIGDLAAARAVVRDNETARSSTRAMLAARQGDARAAGEAALAPGSFVFNEAERWCIAPLLRDLALRDARRRPAVMALLAERYRLSAAGARTIDVGNFREAQLLAQLMLAQGQATEARSLLQDVITWIDTHPQFGPVYNTRTKAQALMLLGRRDEALVVLAQSFAQQDYTFWWYTLEQDPTWAPVRRDPRFVAIDRDVRVFVAGQREELEKLRASGAVPRRAGA